MSYLMTQTITIIIVMITGYQVGRAVRGDNDHAIR